MPAPPVGRCIYPKKKGNRIVWCGNETRCVDGQYALFCSECQKEYEKALKEIKEGHVDKYKREKMRINKVTMNEG
jgi:hypothetical protein